MKVALVHDWLDTYRGGEKVLEKLAEIFPDAPIYTLFYDSQHLPSSLTSKKIIYSYLNPLRKFRKALLPILPSAIESFSFAEFDLVISSSSCVAKGIVPNPNARHICYIHSPMRYVWDQKDQYFNGLSKIPGAMPLVNILLSQLRTWDVASAARVDHFVANSEFVKSRIERYYRRDSSVVHPPVDLDRFLNINKPKESDYFLHAGALVSYKKVEIAIEACEKLKKRLIIAGTGPCEEGLRKIGGKYTEFLGKVDDQKWNELLAGANALLFPGIEDFGILPVEALACGTPVIAYNKGGARDYVIPGLNGQFFEEQNAESLAAVLEVFDPSKLSELEIRNSTNKFHQDHFKMKMIKIIEDVTGVKI